MLYIVQILSLPVISCTVFWFCFVTKFYLLEYKRDLSSLSVVYVPELCLDFRLLGITQAS